METTECQYAKALILTRPATQPDRGDGQDWLCDVCDTPIEIVQGAQPVRAIAYGAGYTVAYQGTYCQSCWSTVMARTGLFRQDTLYTPVTHER